MLSIVLLGITSILALFFGRHLGSRGVGFTSISTLTFVTLDGLSRLWLLIKTGSPSSTLTPELMLGEALDITIDFTNLSMWILVGLISTAVHIYSLEYMSEDPHLVRFLALLQAFTCTMLLLILGSNLLVFYVGYELIGICSYLLISFWYSRIEAASAAILAMIVNRVGDALLLLAMLFSYTKWGTWEWSLVEVSPLFTLGALAKSAQFPLHVWLPLSMAGPTPVSALIHTSTLVTAGILVLIKLGEFSPPHLPILIGCITAILGGSLAIFQSDFKGIVAYSTISQLAYMLVIIGCSERGSALFHLLIHGVFKACLFLSAGAWIHSKFDEQDLRGTGGITNPIVQQVFQICGAALLGLPFTSGFYSKEWIIGATLVGLPGLGPFGSFVLIGGACLTGMYLGRLCGLAFSGSQPALVPLGLTIIFPLLTLTALSTTAGYFLHDIMVGPGTHAGAPGTLTYALEFEHSSSLCFALLPWLLPLLLFLSTLIGYSLENPSLKPHISLPFGATLFGLNAWWIYRLFSIASAKAYRQTLQLTYKLLDRGALIAWPRSLVLKFVFNQKWTNNSIGIQLLMIGICLAFALKYDAPTPRALYFQEPGTQIGEELILFHDQITYYCLIAIIGVIWSLGWMMLRGGQTAIAAKHIQHGWSIELVWTLIPALVLIFIAVPSFRLLYVLDEIIDPALTVKAIGLQWYWTYEYTDYEEKSFDSYCTPDEDLQEGQLRLLEVDNPLVLPVNTHVRIITTANDVMHSFAVPALAIRTDAIPGRLNALSCILKRVGVYYGACMELCGVNHSSMPIVIQGVTLEEFSKWISQ